MCPCTHCYLRHRRHQQDGFVVRKKGTNHSVCLFVACRAQLFLKELITAFAHKLRYLNPAGSCCVRPCVIFFSHQKSKDRVSFLLAAAGSGILGRPAPEPHTIQSALRAAAAAATVASDAAAGGKSCGSLFNQAQRR